MSKKSHNHRIFELDFLRGLALVMMCLDHLAYDLYCLPYWFSDADTVWIYRLGDFGEAVAFSQWRLVLHYIFATLFLLMAGVGSALTRNHKRRVLQVGGAALTITLVTVTLDLFFHMGATILFGVLSAMTVGALLCWICSLFGEKWGKWIALGGGVAIIAVGFVIKWYDSTHVFRISAHEIWSVIFGTLQYGSDWFPIFPCAGVLLVGYFLGKVLYKRRQSLIPCLRGKTDHFFCAIGRKPLWIYLLHQPVIMAALYGILWLLEG